MSFLDYFSKIRVPNVDVVEKKEDYGHDVIGSIEIPDKLCEQNVFNLANSVTEIYFPIDFYADRASKLRYFIADKNGKEIENTELNRFITTINPLYSHSDLVYQYIFSYLSDGNAISYIGVPSLFSSSKISANNISRIDILQPNRVTLYEYNTVNELIMNSRNDYIRRATYQDGAWHNSDLIIDRINIDCIDSVKKTSSFILSKSPLFKSVRSINNLLATYSARYNVYANNGSAGYLVKKSGGKSQQEEMISPTTRDEMLKDINARNGITGRRNFWGLSSIPIEFINTLASIKDLLPFEETFEDSVKIASIYQLPAELLPRKDNSTFDNKDTAERSVWENGLMSMVDTFCENYTKICRLDLLGYKVMADYSSVSVLKANEKSKAEISSIEIDNLIKIKQAYPEKADEINKLFDKIIENGK